MSLIQCIYCPWAAHAASKNIAVVSSRRGQLDVTADGQWCCCCRV